MKKGDLPGNKGIAFRIGKNYLNSHLASIKADDATGHILNEEEKQQLKKLHYKVYAVSACIGAFFVLITIVPYHFTQWFGVQQINLFNHHFSFEFYYSIYVLVMIFPEILLLNILNVWAVREICEIHKYPSPDNDDYEEQITILAEAGLEIPDQRMKSLNINPYIGFSKASYYLLFLLAKAKAALSNVVIKLLVRRFLGRYALKVLIDLAGVPVYSFWDAWASHQVMKEAQMRLVAGSAVKQFVDRFPIDELQSVEDQIPALINYIAQEKRNYNYALYSFMKRLLKVMPDMNLETVKRNTVSDFITNDQNKNNLLSKLLVFGFIVDGTLSLKERFTLMKLSRESWFPMDMNHIDQIMKKYVKGEGLEFF